MVAKFILYIILTVSGVTLVKLGAANPLFFNIQKNALNMGIGFCSLLGYLCYICSFLLYMNLMAKYELSFIVPIATGAIYLLQMVVAVVIFHEKITFLSGAGNLLILIGVIIVAVSDQIS